MERNIQIRLEEARKWNIPSGYMVKCIDRYGNEIKVSVE